MFTVIAWTLLGLLSSSKPHGSFYITERFFFQKSMYEAFFPLLFYIEKFVLMYKNRFKLVFSPYVNILITKQPKTKQKNSKNHVASVVRRRICNSTFYSKTAVKQYIKKVFMWNILDVKTIRKRSSNRLYPNRYMTSIFKVTENRAYTVFTKLFHTVYRFL